jgi:hypothetical protein
LRARWEEPWSRLLAFREHLPEHYEIPESLVRTYHDLISELGSATHLDLKNFRIPPEEIRPKVVSVNLPRMRRTGKVNYSSDEYCLRTNLLMRLDGLIRFVESQFREARPTRLSTNSGPLLPYEKRALALYGFTESAGKSRWRPTSMGDLWNTAHTEDGVIVDELKRLRAERFMGMRKWSEVARDFVPYADEPGADADFFYASSEESVGDGKRQRAVSVRNRRSFLQVESKDLC